LVAFRSSEQLKIRPRLLAGPEVAPPNLMVELDTATRYFAPTPNVRRAHAWSERSNVAKLLQPITGARLVATRGQAIAEMLADLPEERRLLGPSGLTAQQMLSVCEDPQLDFELVHEGEQFDARYHVDPHLFMTQPRPALYALTSTCTAALLASNGDVAEVIGAGCTAEDQEAHFPPSSRCRTCLNADGDHGRCVAAGQCKELMTRELLAQNQYWDLLEAETLSCAPNYFITTLALVGELGEDNVAPSFFEHGKIVNFCNWFWKAGVEEPRLYCHQPDLSTRPAIGDLLVGRVEYIRHPGSTAAPHEGRVYFSSGVEVEGRLLEAIALSPDTLGPISDNRENGFGWNPQLLRPDGTNPANIDHTFARDWIGTVSVKTATEITGVPVSYRNRNLCGPTDWEGPDDKGRFFCKQPIVDEEEEEEEEEEPWGYDYAAFYYSYDPVDLELRPLTTLAATGKMDPNIAGGHVSKIYGSTQLADPDWDNCTWPDTFEPDEMLTTAAYDEEYTHTSQTYRFDAHPERDVRVSLSSSWRRIFCPGPVED
jgi:hypothetical protein